MAVAGSASASAAVQTALWAARAVVAAASVAGAAAPPASGKSVQLWEKIPSLRWGPCAVASRHYGFSLAATARRANVP